MMMKLRLRRFVAHPLRCRMEPELTLVAESEMTLSGYILTTLALILVLCVDAWIIASVLRSDHGWRTRMGWCALVVLFPFIGWAVWGRYGPRGMVYPPASTDPTSGNTVRETLSPANSSATPPHFEGEANASRP